MRPYRLQACLLTISLWSIALSGCASDPSGGLGDGDPPYEREYAEVYQATRRVLERHFGRIQTSYHTAGKKDLYVLGRIHSDGISQYRMKVTARVVMDEDDHFVPEVRVEMMVDTSDPIPDKRSVAQPNHRWTQVGFQHDMEAQLLNEIHRELGQRDFATPFFTNPLPQAQPAADPSAF
jgi:hypothetical protein